MKRIRGVAITGEALTTSVVDMVAAEATETVADLMGLVGVVVAGRVWVAHRGAVASGADGKTLIVLEVAMEVEATDQIGMIS